MKLQEGNFNSQSMHQNRMAMR